MKYLKDKALIKATAYVLKQLRDEKGLTQIEVYNDTNIHVGRIEAAKRDLKLSTLSTLLAYYKVSLSDFFKQVENF